MARATIKTRIEDMLKLKHGAKGVGVRRLLQSTKKIIKKAVSDANVSCELYGYFLTVVTETGAQISAKLFKLTEDDDHLKTPDEFLVQTGYPLNLQVSERSGKVVVYSYRFKASTKTIVTSDKHKEIQDAVVDEVVECIRAGIEFLNQAKR